jgi:hypothetical protein
MKPTSAHGHGDELSNPGVAHETSDVNVRAILWFAAIVTVTTMFCAVIVWGVFNLLESQAAGRDPKMSPLAMPAATMPRTTTASPFFGNGPAPQLMTDEPAHLAHQRLLEDTKLHQYGWVDEKSGVTRLPIDQAKKLLSERGLPARPAGSDAWLGTHSQAYGESSGGRTIPTGEKPAAAATPAGAPAPQVPHAPETPKAPAPAAAGHGSGH